MSTANGDEPGSTGAPGPGRVALTASLLADLQESAHDGTPIGRATVLDVARRARVSGRTVSRVVSGGGNVSADTRQRVMRAVEELRFRPNRLARDLRTGGVATTVGFVMGDLTNPFYSRVAAGIERVLVDRGLTMLIAATRDDPAMEPRMVDAVLEHRVRALLLVPIGDDHAYLDHELGHGTPIVSVDRPAANADLDSVVFDNSGGAAAAISSLLAAGHRHIAFVGSDPALYTHRERLAGYRLALSAAGVTEQPRWVRTDAPDSGSAERATRELLALAEPPTAIFAANNVAALGVLRGLRDHRPPLALIAFDDFDLADALAITVVAHDPERMGGSAAELALAEPAEPRARTRLVLPTWLVRRGSGEIPPAC